MPLTRPLVYWNLPPERCDPATARTGVIGAPYDGSIPTRGGTKDGPLALLHASQEMELFDLDIGDDPSRLGIATLGMVDVDVDGPEAMTNRVQAAVAEVAARGQMPFLVGGEHSVTIGAVRALAARYPDLTVLQLDAHGDLRDAYQGSGYSHACVMRRVLETCPAVQIGIRTLGEEEMSLIADGGAHVVRIDQMRDDAGAVGRALERLSGHVYVTVDLDVLDPSVMPSVAFPEPDGLSYRETLNMLREAAQTCTIVGCDMVELAPNLGPLSAAYLAAHLGYRLIGYATILGAHEGG